MGMTGLRLFATLLLWAGTFYLLGFAYGRKLGVGSIPIRAAVILLVLSIALAVTTR
jgi:hypothetical protein